MLPVSFSVFSLFFALFSTNSYGAHEDKKYIIGYINHPRVNAFYKPLIQRAYEDIGITPIFEEVGGERGLRLLNQGMTDADVIRYDVASQQDNNILIVEPALSHGASYLLCMRKVKCDKSIIDDPNSAIAATTRFFDNMKAKPSELAANIFEFDDFHHVIFYCSMDDLTMPSYLAIILNMKNLSAQALNMFPLLSMRLFT